MKFRYKNVAPKIDRPIIPIKVSKNGRSVNYEVLIDSGADRNIFHAEIATYLEIDLKSGSEIEIVGVTGKVEKGYVHQVKLEIGGHSYDNVEVAFFEHLSKFAHGMVGQSGFFDMFTVKFDKNKKEIEIK